MPEPQGPVLIIRLLGPGRVQVDGGALQDELLSYAMLGMAQQALTVRAMKREAESRPGLTPEELAHIAEQDRNMAEKRAARSAA